MCAWGGACGSPLIGFGSLKLMPWDPLACNCGRSSGRVFQTQELAIPLGFRDCTRACFNLGLDIGFGPGCQSSWTRREVFSVSGRTYGYGNGHGDSLAHRLEFCGFGFTFSWTQV